MPTSLARTPHSISPELRVARPIPNLIQELPGVFEYPEEFVPVVGCTYSFVDSMRVGSAKYRPMHGDACVGKDHCDGQNCNAR
jgi:hypothetical protein